MKVLLLTNEYPPHTYGGAGVHIEYLSRELARLMDVEVRTFQKQRTNRKRLRILGFRKDITAYKCPDYLKPVFAAASRGIDFNTAGIDADIVHCHTWYSYVGGILARLNYGTPLVITVHSLEPLRPWKREQLERGYDYTCWLEKTAIEMADAIIAVSAETKQDILRLYNVPEDKVRIIHNGIDPNEYRPLKNSGTLEEYGIDPVLPYILFVGRIARQKGIGHFLNAIKYLTPGFQVVLCAWAPDTKELSHEFQLELKAARENHPGIIWVNGINDKKKIAELYSNATVFCCPSIYEPFGIINLEAMACETAVVASAVGGIKEVVLDGETGSLVWLDQMHESPFEPHDPDRFARDLADKVNILMADPKLCARYAKAGRQRAIEKFSWSHIAEETRDLYAQLLANR